jgi:hypothetical protein
LNKTIIRSEADVAPVKQTFASISHFTTVKRKIPPSLKAEAGAKAFATEYRSYSGRVIHY